MNKAYEEVKLCVENNKHNLSTETLQLCLEALRIVKDQISHNGYTNYPTWLVAAEIDNNSRKYETYREMVEKMQQEGADDDTIRSVLFKVIETDYATDCMKYQLKCVNTVWSSMLNYCERDLINYREITDTFLNDL